jgi:glycosyltransferase involved in cell wall biosynthesis
MTPGQDFAVSVIIPVYNAERFLTEAVESAIHLPEVREVILVEDGSTDGSFDLALRLQETYPGLRVLKHADRQNHGVSASRNRGIMAASCEWVAFLDADDYYLPNRFATEKEIFLTAPQVDAVYGCNQAVFTSKEAREKFLRHYESETTTLTKILPPQELFTALLFGGYGRFHTSAITLRKRVFAKTGMFNPGLRMGEDTELWLKLALATTMVAGSIKEPVAIRRVHDTNSIHNMDRVQTERPRMYQSLFDWVLRQPFPFAVKNACFICLHRFGKGEDYDVKNFFWGQFYRRPQLMFSTFFYKKIHQLYLIR